jgi:excisionase family DNA binding protein
MNEKFSLAEAAAELKISTRALRDLCRAGRITFSRVHKRSWIFTRADIDAFLERNRFQARTLR